MLPAPWRSSNGRCGAVCWAAVLPPASMSSIHVLPTVTSPQGVGASEQRHVRPLQGESGGQSLCPLLALSPTPTLASEVGGGGHPAASLAFVAFPSRPALSGGKSHASEGKVLSCPSCPFLPSARQNRRTGKAFTAGRISCHRRLSSVRPPSPPQAGQGLGPCAKLTSTGATLVGHLRAVCPWVVP